jgi:ribosomal protein L32
MSGSNNTHESIPKVTKEKKNKQLTNYKLKLQTLQNKTKKLRLKEKTT